MKELNTSTSIRGPQVGGGGGLGSLFDSDTDHELVTVVHGAHDERLPLANLTIGQVRVRFADRFNIGPQSQAILDGNEVNDDTRVQPGQTLMFVHRIGGKGSRQHGTPI
jgi:hypothetical protein